MKRQALAFVLDVGRVAAIDQTADDGDDATAQIGLVELVVDAADRERAVATDATRIAHRQRAFDLGFGERIGSALGRREDLRGRFSDEGGVRCAVIVLVELMWKDALPSG